MRHLITSIMLAADIGVIAFVFLYAPIDAPTPTSADYNTGDPMNTDNYLELKASRKLWWERHGTAGNIIPVFDYERNGRYIWLHTVSIDCVAPKFGFETEQHR